MTKHKQLNRSCPRGLTLMELLVVVTIISVIAAMMIPRLRMINKDRNIREAARVVGSVFANASQRSVNEGRAGVLLERHPNFVDAAGVNFACTTMYTMRALPPYLGDDETSVATYASPTMVTIPTPFEQSELNVIRINDYIRLNNSSVRYRITGIPSSIPPAGMPMALTIDNAGFLPPPPSGSYPFVIYRQPRKLESSRVELPEGYVIDLRYSGPLADTSSPADGTFDAAVLNQITGADEIAVIFDSAGAVDFLYYNEPGPFSVSLPPSGSLYWLVAAYEPESTVLPIFQPSNFWVTVNNITGGVNVGYSVPATPGFDFDGDGDTDIADQIQQARGIANLQQSADQ